MEPIDIWPWGSGIIFSLWTIAYVVHLVISFTKWLNDSYDTYDDFFDNPNYDDVGLVFAVIGTIFFWPVILFGFAMYGLAIGLRGLVRKAKKHGKSS